MSDNVEISESTASDAIQIRTIAIQDKPGDSTLRHHPIYLLANKHGQLDATLQDVLEMLCNMHKELKKQTIHLQSMTGINIENKDVG